MSFIENYLNEIIITGFVLIALLIVRYGLHFTVTKVAKKNGMNDARIRPIKRYITVIIFLVALIIEAFIFGTELKELTLVFSSVFAVIGIGLFAVWSILSNITSGIIIFFNFPHKVGDKIKIHDSDMPETGIIEDIKSFHLILRLENGDFVTYPNNLLLQKAVTLIEKNAILDILEDRKEDK